MINMRAKFQVQKVEQYYEGGDSTKPVVQETIYMSAVTSKPYDANGFNEDNTFAKWTPAGSCTLSILNPALLGQYKVGDKLYSDFTVASE